MRELPVRSLVILNPQSGGGSAERNFRAVEDRVRQALAPCEVERTRGPRDAVRLAREALRAGVERIVVAGGDGTLGEAVTGLLAAGPGLETSLGLLPLGTGADFRRSAGIPQDLAAAAEALAEGKRRPVDAGRVRFRGPDGAPAEAGFLNVASFGVSGLVVELVNQAPKAFGGRMSFLIGTLRAILRFRCRPVTIKVDGKTVFEGPLVLCAVANGGWFGGGMHVAPGARLDDGLLDVVVVGELTRPQIVVKLGKIYSGVHLDDPSVSHFRGRVVEAEAAPGEVPLELDGDPLGCLPARFEVVPAAVSLLGSAP